MGIRLSHDRYRKVVNLPRMSVPAIFWIRVIGMKWKVSQDRLVQIVERAARLTEDFSGLHEALISSSKGCSFTH